MKSVKVFLVLASVSLIAFLVSSCSHHQVKDDSVTGYREPSATRKTPAKDDGDDAAPKKRGKRVAKDDDKAKDDTADDDTDKNPNFVQDDDNKDDVPNPAVTPREASVCIRNKDRDAWGKKLAIEHLAVGQGDSIYIRTPSGTRILIDAGPTGEGEADVFPFMQQCYGDDVDADHKNPDPKNTVVLDYLVITHPHDDHFGGFRALVGGNGPHKLIVQKKVFIPAVLAAPSKTSKAQPAQWVQLLKDIAKTTGQKPQVIDFGTDQIVDKDVKFDVVVRGGQTKGGKVVDGVKNQNGDVTDDNTLSIGIMVTFDKFKYYAAGDETGKGKGGHPDVEGAVASALSKVDVYKASHHGSDTSNQDSVLKILQPTSIIVSTGLLKKNGDNSKKDDSTSKFHLPDKVAMVRMATTTPIKASRKNDPHKGKVGKIFMTSRGESFNQDKTAFLPTEADETKNQVVDFQGDVLIMTDGKTNYTVDGPKDGDDDHYDIDLQPKGI